MKHHISLGALALAACVTNILGSVCHNSYGGQCLNSLSQCPPGSHVSFSYCGFLQVCCYSSHSVPTHTGSSSGSSGASTSHGDPSCVDLHPSCPSWAATGECSSNPSYMLHNCKAACGQCSSAAAAVTHAPVSSEQCGVSTVNSGTKIVGGVVATAHEFPWQVSLMYNGQHMCGGTLIDKQWVVSAAHCFENTHRELWHVALGLHDAHHIARSNYLKVNHIYVHGSFNSHNNNGNDIALMQLEKPVDISGADVRTACLPQAHESFDGDVCTVTGWGSQYEDGPVQQFLHKVNVPIITNSQCSYYVGSGLISSTNICAGVQQGGKDACQGDSGGPLVCKVGGHWKLAGVVSWGFGCGQRNAPGIYTRVSEFLNWIEQAKSMAG